MWICTLLLLCCMGLLWEEERIQCTSWDTTRMLQTAHALPSLRFKFSCKVLRSPLEEALKKRSSLFSKTTQPPQICQWRHRDYLYLLISNWQSVVLRPSVIRLMVYRYRTVGKLLYSCVGCQRTDLNSCKKVGKIIWCYNNLQVSGGCSELQLRTWLVMLYLRV